MLHVSSLHEQIQIRRHTDVRMRTVRRGLDDGGLLVEPIVELGVSAASHPFAVMHVTGGSEQADEVFLATAAAGGIN